MPRVDNTILFEDARMIFRNFKGEEGMYNREGDRNFCVLLEPELAEQLAADGWNVKTLKPREDDEDPQPQPYLQVSVSYKGRPPQITMISSKNRQELGEREDQIDPEVLDWVDIKKVDFIVNPYNWSVNDKTGISAYLKTMFVTINEDYLQLKYADIDDLPSSGGRSD